jgi:hypothetical protein
LTRITVPYDRRTVAATVQAILNAVTVETGLRFGVGSLPFLPPDMADFSASNVTARDALANLFAQAGRLPVTFWLLFDPDPRRPFEYIINFHYAGATPAQAPNSAPPPPPPPPPAGPRPGQRRANPQPYP